jgi:glycosyltransferase involved in cell wall biosynthesis
VTGERDSSTRSFANAARRVRALYFGTYERDYPRNAQVISCLRRAGVDVIERHLGLWEGTRDKWSLGPIGVLRLVAAEIRLAASRPGAFDVIIVGYPGHFDMPAARRLAQGRPIVFNPLVSLWDTLVADRKRFSSRSPAAGVLRRVDRISFRRADLVVADTEQHARYFAESFALPRERVAVCLVGAEDRLFPPGWQPAAAFHALFVGKLIPLHGLETILEAARMLPEVLFRVVGSGQLEPLLASRPANVEWTPWVAYEKLPAAIKSAGVVLGIFGRSQKTARVIPNKAFQALACGAPLVTGDTPAARELLTDGVDALLVPTGDSKALAAAIRRLAGDREFARRIGTAGRATYALHASEPVLGARWRQALERLLGR